MSTAPSPGKSSAPGREVILAGRLHVPGEVADLDSFCRWALSDDFPEDARICWLAGTVWVDLEMEAMYSHNGVITEFTRVLGGLTRMLETGRYLSDGMRFRNTPADLSTEPDGMFVSYHALRTGRVIRVDTGSPECVLLEGTPEMVLEVVSQTSVDKDTVTLRDLYWRAGIAEFWLVDVRAEPHRFQILRHRADGYVAARRVGGWLRSTVFNRSFRLDCQPDPLGDPQFTLAVRE